MADKFFIGPYDDNSGLQTNFRPWAIPENAFAELNNAYVFRGRLRKRFGSQWLSDNPLKSRLRINIGTTDAGGNFGGFVPTFAGVPIATPAIGQVFSIGTEVFTVIALGNPSVMLRSANTLLATYDTTNGAVVFVGATPLTTIYFYPVLPVMGLRTFEQNTINDEKIIAFDTRFAYEYNNGWERLAGEAVPGAAHWGGLDTDYFWTCTWTGVDAFNRVFFVTNFNQLEPMRTFFAGQWNDFEPQVSATEFLFSARIIVPFKNRLLCFNTWEGTVDPGNNYTNRCRYSAAAISPFDPNSWRQDVKGNGNAIDAPITESIVSVEFIKDRLIVFFERSTWEIVFTGNQIQPFVWQQINTELGVESTFSIVPFDKVTLGIGNVGVHACNGSNVERIDNKIPDTVFDIHNVNQGVFRVYGIRDYEVEMVYWTFPDAETDDEFPFCNRVLVYNYKTQTWAFNDDSITVFGYFQPQTDITWDSTTITFSDIFTWDAGLQQAKTQEIIAGNQQGFTFLCDADETTNASVLYITNITVVNNVVTITAPDHNLRAGEFLFFQGIIDTGNLNLINGQIFEVEPPIDANIFTFDYEDDLNSDLAGTYKGGGLMARVSKISIKTKEFNFYAKQGRNAYISKVDFLVDKTDSGEMQVDYYVSTSAIPLLEDSSLNGTLLGTGTLDTFAYTAANGALAPIEFEEQATRLWHPVYFQADGEVIQLQLTMNDAQMTDVSIAQQDFQLHAMVITAQPTSSRFQ